MMRLLVVTCIMFGMVFGAAANGNTTTVTAENRAGNLSDQMIRELRLNNYQASKIRNINLNKAAKMLAVETEFAGNEKMIEEKCKSICAERDRELERVLTTAQYNNYFGSRKYYNKFDKEFMATAGQQNAGGSDEASPELTSQNN